MTLNQYRKGHSERVSFIFNNIFIMKIKIPKIKLSDISMYKGLTVITLLCSLVYACLGQWYYSLTDFNYCVLSWVIVRYAKKLKSAKHIIAFQKAMLFHTCKGCAAMEDYRNAEERDSETKQNN